ncbi:MAG: hypothetical protein U9R38_02680 [Candidatus Margulisiibacteriota bacterium]|nr:hypothetical protein [Candidatus Margulisiibacteriota bacterium]
MAIPFIKNTNPQSIRFGLLGRAIRFTAARFTGKRYLWNARKLGYKIGSEEHPNVGVLAPTDAETLRAKQFFKENNIDGSRKCVVGVYKRDDNGQVETMRWVSVGKIKGFIWAYLRPLLGKSLDNVIHVRKSGEQELELTHGHRTGVIELTDMQIPNIQWADRVEVLDQGKTLRVHYREQLSEARRYLDYEDFDITQYGLHKAIKQGKVEVFHNPNDSTDPYTAKVFTKRWSVESRKPAPEGLGEDTVIDKTSPRFYLKVTLTSKSKFKVKGLELKDGYDATVVRVRSSLKLVHLNESNGKTEGAVEWMPFDKKVQSFPARTEENKKNATHMHPEGDPRDDLGSGVKDGMLSQVVASQHFAPLQPEVESQIWPYHDQLGYFGEDMRSFLAYPHGEVEGRKTPWFMPKGRHSLQEGKFISQAAIFTGSNGMDRAVWIDRLFMMEDVELKRPQWSQLMHLITITEDAQGAHEKALVFDEHTMYDPEVKSIAATIETVKAGYGQRRRWGAMIGYFLSFAFKYVKDEWVRHRAYGALSKLPLAGRIFARKKIPHTYTAAQSHEWINTGSWYFDTVVKYAFAITPSLYIFFGMTPLPATMLFLTIWAGKTLFGWPAYSRQMGKVGVSPSRTIGFLPKDIFYWYLYMPSIAQGTLHMEDEGFGPFASTAQMPGKNIEPSVKRKVFWPFTAVPLAAGLTGTTYMAIAAFAGKAGAIAAAAGALWPLGIAVGGSIILKNIMEKIWPGERTKRYQSVIKFVATTVSIIAGGYFAVTGLAAAAFEASLLTGLLMNTVWSLYMGIGTAWAWTRYLKDQAIYKKAEQNIDAKKQYDTPWNLIKEWLFIDVIQRVVWSRIVGRRAR